MSKVIPHVVDSCGECHLRTLKDSCIGFYCCATGERIEKLSRINADCPYNDYTEIE